MGDAGSLAIGSIFCVLSINSINESYLLAPIWIQTLNKAVLAMSILAYPLIDTLRVFTLRILRDKSPFTADKNHIHHNFEKIGFGHAKSSLSIFFLQSVSCTFSIVFTIIFKHK